MITCEVDIQESLSCDLSLFNQHYYANINSHSLFLSLSLGHTTPAPSVHGSDDEDSVDEETELKELGIK